MRYETLTCRWIGVALCEFALAAPILGAAQGPQPAGEAQTRVEIGRPIEREIASGQSHDYVVEVPAGGYFHADVEQRGIDVAVSVFDPAGAQLTEVDSLTGAASSESVSIVAKTAGTYRFAVHVGEGADPPSGRYVIKASAPRPAGAADESRTSAEYASHRGLALWLEETDEGRVAALREYSASLASYTAAGDARGQADALSTLGAISNELSRFDDALTFWERELPIRTAIDDTVGEAVALNNVGIVHYQRSEFRRAQGYFEKALAIAKASSDTVSEAILRSRLGSILSALGRKRESIAALSDALPLVHEHAGPVEEARLLLALGSAYYDVGDRKKSLDVLGRALALWRSVVKGGVAPPAGEIEAMVSVAVVYSDLGEREKALALFSEARDRAESIDDRTGTSRAYNFIGQTLYQLGDSPTAIENYTKALDAAIAGGYKAGELVVLHNIGGAYAAMRDDPRNDQRAMTYYARALRGFRATGNRPYEILARIGLGEIYLRRRELSRAEATLSLARSLTRSSNDRAREAIALKLLGDVAAARRDWRTALARYDEALPLAREARFAGGDATVLRGIAVVERDRGRLDEARAKIEEAISIVESVRSRVESSDYRASFFASARPYYDFYVDLLMRMHRREPTNGYDAEALRASERARARSLVEMLSESNATVRGGLDPERAERLAALRAELAAKTIAETRALAAGDQETTRSVRAEVATLSDAYRAALDEANKASPRYAEIASPTTLDLARVRAEVLDADTALVEYFLGDERSYAWVVTTTSIRSHTLPGRVRIESAVRRARDVLVSSKGPRRDLALAAAPEVSAARAARSARLEREYLAAVAPLARMVLDPLARDLTKPRVLVVADGALAYVPFGALPFVATNAKAAEPLLVAREVVYAPSASALAVMRRETAGRAPAPKLLALFADPVFDAADSRVRKTDAPAVDDDPLSSRSLVLAAAAQSAKDVGFTGGPSPFPRLPFTRQEADAIAALAAEGDRKVALDFAASRDAATDGGLAGYRIVHFATHGYLNSIRPELSGLVLSLCDEGGAPSPGFLATPDVFDMKLDADLVVLSACETGLGKEVRGEGIVGLTRAFMYAGSPSVVVSLWSVSDRATAALMTELYDGMLKRGLTPAAALRAAQLELYRQERWRAPFYWAPFVLQGEWM